MTIRRLICATLIGLPAIGGCSDAVPTSGSDRLMPEAQTFEIHIPYAEFARDLQVFGGYASAEALSNPPVAHAYRGDLEARALIEFGLLPAAIQVFPPGSSSSVADSAYVVTGGRLVLEVDTVSWAEVGFLEVAARSLQTEWHPPSADWEHAVDTLGDRRPWPEAGGGPAPEAGVASWDPLQEDTVSIPLDPETAAAWADRENRAPGALIEGRTPDTFLRIRSAVFRAEAESEINPDTVVTLSAGAVRSTVIYTPEPGVDPSQIRIGGAPARRAFLRIEPPRRIEVGSDLCADVPCPLDIDADRVVYAGLVLETTATEPSAFRLHRPLAMDVRPALAPDRIPRSPLGAPLQGGTLTLQPEQFGDAAGARVEVPMTRYLRDRLRAEEGEDQVPHTLTFFASTEPSDIPFATFRGPGQDGEPYLRVILTVSDGVQLP